MQVVLILGGGIGKRFGTVLPKQYNLIDGKPVIDYVIEQPCKPAKRIESWWSVIHNTVTILDI